MGKDKVSIKDIARIVGVSPATISFVINGKGPERKIRTETINKVMDVVLKKGYRPNSFAQNLRKGSSRTIGFLVEDISRPFFSDVASVLERMMSEMDYTILIGNFGEKGEKISTAIDLLKSRCVDGYVIAALPSLKK